VPDPDPAPRNLEISRTRTVPASILRFSAVRSSGPGGQNVNKVATKMRLRVSVEDLAPILGPSATRRLSRLAGARLTAGGDLLITADQSRSQRANRRACLGALQTLLKRALQRPKVRKKTSRSRASIQRRLNEKKHRAGLKGLRRMPADEP